MAAPNKTDSTAAKNAAPVKAVTHLEDDDAFEDFPADIAASAVATATTETLGTFATKWIDSWEEDDDTEDFALQLKAQETAKNVAPMRS